MRTAQAVAMYSSSRGVVRRVTLVMSAYEAWDLTPEEARELAKSLEAAADDAATLGNPAAGEVSRGPTR